MDLKLISVAEEHMRRGRWAAAVQALKAGAVSRADLVLRLAQLQYRMDCVAEMGRLLERGLSREELLSALAAAYDEYVAGWALNEYHGLKLLRGN